MGCQKQSLGRLFLFLASLALSAPFSYAQVAVQPAAMRRYPQIKTWQEKQWALSRTPEERLEILRQTVRKGRYSGDPRLPRMFQNLERELTFDPEMPGLGRTILLSASDSTSQVRGASRTLRYAGVINGDRRFELTRLNEPYANAAGKTDADIEFRHMETGRKGRIEVKEWSEESQRTNLAKAESQFRKMAEDRRVSGRLQAWVNRRANTPEIEALGRKYQVPVYGDVATGKAAARPGQMTLKVVLDDIDRRAASFSRASGGGAQFGFGIYQLVVSGHAFSRELDLLLDPEQAGQASLLHLGESGSLALGGGFLAVSGGIKVAQTLEEARKLSDVGRVASRLSGLSKWSGRLGILATATAGGLVAWEYYRGGLTDRQFSDRKSTRLNSSHVRI